MTQPAADTGRVGRLDADLVAVRERLARLEAQAEAHERASAKRHRELMEAVEVLGERVEKVETRAWKLALGLTALGLGGGAGAVELLRAALGG